MKQERIHIDNDQVKDGLAQLKDVSARVKESFAPLKADSASGEMCSARLKTDSASGKEGSARVKMSSARPKDVFRRPKMVSAPTKENVARLTESSAVEESYQCSVAVIRKPHRGEELVAQGNALRKKVQQPISAFA